MERIEIRESVPGDLAAIELLYPEAFPEEDLLPLVRELLEETAVTLSLVAIVESCLVGHGIFTTCGVAGSSANVALLGPLAVASARQREGLGSAIVKMGMRRLEKAGVTHVYVLGDPAYYGRLGFVPEAQVVPPYQLPAEWGEAWQSMSLSSAAPRPRGTLTVPQPWREPVLWGP